ncbi:MAG: hypothetical protein COB85_09670 [Bacteroidetes bacterium]|nr:MAG: hypothetical protein COB85_09670 [Bacteroidota bacterium]
MMIVKTSRYKTKRFSELIDYIMSDQGRIREDQTFTIYHNLRSTEKEAIVREFGVNDQFRKKRKRGVILYHEILSFSPKDKGRISLKALEDMAQKFIELRGDRALCFAKPHIENENVHIHFCFSGTEYKSSKTLRLDNNRFKGLRKDIEAYQAEKYPELENSLCYLNKWQKDRFVEFDQEKAKQNDREIQFKRRTGKKSDKEIVSELLKDCLQKSESKNDFFNRIISQGVALYKYREKVNGIQYNGRKFRFKTLDVPEREIQLLERNYERVKELEKIIQEKEERRNLGKGRNR